MRESTGNSTIIFSMTSQKKEEGPRHRSLVVLSGAEIGVEFRLEPEACPMMLGRNSDCPALLQAASVSRRHAQIEWEPERDGGVFVISDTGSSNGTWVNHTPASKTPLYNGDRVRMGDVLLKFVEHDEVDARFHEDVHRLIHYDQLTGLMTMEAFRRRLDAAIHHGAEERPFCLAMTDLDGLKQVNDRYGHLAGRMVVREMGVMIRESLRTQDLSGLYGGDETILLFPETPLEEAHAVAERLRLCIEARRFEFEDKTFQVSISQGLAEWPRHGKTAEALIATADRALYTAKASGRNCIRLAPAE